MKSEDPCKVTESDSGNCVEMTHVIEGNHMEFDTTYFDQFYLECRDIANLLEDGTETEKPFEKLVSILHTGYLHKDAIILFMLGLYELNKTETISKKFEGIRNNVFPKEMPSSRELFLQSAKEGLDQAKLWCAYCYSEGIYGFPQNYSQSEMLLNLIEERPFDNDICDLRWLKDECERAAETWNSEESGDESNSLRETSRLLLELISCASEIPQDHDWEYTCWILDMNRYESCSGTGYVPPVIPEREQNKERSDALYTEGKMASDNKEYEKAKECFLEAISYNRENIDLYSSLCLTYMKLKEKEHAIWAATIVGDLGYPIGYSCAGRFYAPSVFTKPGFPDENDYERALLFLNKALELYTDPVKIGNHLYYMATVYVKREMHEKAALYAHLSAMYKDPEGILLYGLLKEKISQEAVQEAEGVIDLQTLKQKDNLLETRGKLHLYPKALVYTFDHDTYSSQITVKFINPDHTAFQNFISIYNDSEELERITEEIFYEGKPARIIECEYCRIVIDLLTVKVRSNFLGCRAVSETSTLSWLYFLKVFNSEKTALKQRKESDMSLSVLSEAEQERRGVRQLKDLMEFYNSQKKQQGIRW